MFRLLVAMPVKMDVAAGGGGDEDDGLVVRTEVGDSRKGQRKRFERMCEKSKVSNPLDSVHLRSTTGPRLQ